MNIAEAVNTKYTVIGTGRYLRTLEHDSLVIDTERNTFYWNSFGYGGDVYTFLTKVLGIKHLAATFMATPATDFSPPEDEELKQDLHLTFWNFGKAKRDFWYKRGFTDTEIDLYKLGYFAGVYTLPFVMNGYLNAIILRGKDKFISEINGSRKSLFGYDELKTKNILLVESPLDVPLLRRFGYEAISYTYGANAWDKSWNALFYDYNVTIIPDNDSAGKNILKKISFYAKIVRWPKNTPKGFDIGKLYFNNKEKFVANIDYLIDTAIPINLL